MVWRGVGLPAPIELSQLLNHLRFEVRALVRVKGLRAPKGLEHRSPRGPGSGGGGLVGHGDGPGILCK